MAEKSEDHHVKFATGTHLDPDPIHIIKSDDPCTLPEAHIGILRNHHTYSAAIPIPHSIGPLVNARHGQSNIHCTVMEIPETVEAEGMKADEGKYISIVKVRVKTIKEGSIAEKIEVFADGGEGSMEVLLTAKILKASQGNPLLKDGVKIISHEHSDESDFTEWPGHNKEEN